MESLYWLPAAIVSLLCFGLWGFFSKLTINFIDARSALVYQSLGVTIIGFIALIMLQFKPAAAPKGITYGLLTGITYGIGCLFFFIAADRGKVTTVVTMTALYPLVTIFLAYLLLHEAINMRQGAGIVLALIALYLMS
jgi:bacterial/archaeal transporter family protein